MDNDNKECKLDFLDKDDNPLSNAHKMDAPTSTTDLSVRYALLYLIACCHFCAFTVLQKNAALWKKFSVSARTNLKVLETLSYI